MKHNSTDPERVDANAPAPIGHNSNGATASPPPSAAKTARIRVPVEQVLIWPALTAQVDDMLSFDLDEEVEILRTSGQRMPVVVRRLEDDRYEAIGHAHLVRIVEERNRRDPTSALEIDIHIMRLDDDAAYRLVAQELEPRSEISSYARGCFFADAVKHYGSEQEAAKMCRVSKAAMSKNLDVHRAIAMVGAKIIVHRDVSQRDAMWLMKVMGRKLNGADAPDQEKRRAVLAAFNAMEAASAKKVFVALRKSVKVDQPSKGTTMLTHEGREIGSMRERTKGGPITFEIINAGDIELDHVIEIVREALALKRR